MMKWIIVIAFNILFGLLSGFITNKIFYLGDGPYEERSAYDNKKNKQMVLIITVVAALSGTFIYLLSDYHTKWYAAGIIFGIITTVLTPATMYLVDKWEALINRSKSEIVIDSKMKFLSELINSMKFMEVYVTSIFTLLYGIISLLTPILGLLWGYIMYKYIIKIN